VKKTILLLVGTLALVLFFSTCQAVKDLIGGGSFPNAPSNVDVTPVSVEVTVSRSNVTEAQSYTVKYQTGSFVTTDLSALATTGSYTHYGWIGGYNDYMNATLYAHDNLWLANVTDEPALGQDALTTAPNVCAFGGNVSLLPLTTTELDRLQTGPPRPTCIHMPSR